MAYGFRIGFAVAVWATMLAATPPDAHDFASAMLPGLRRAMPGAVLGLDSRDALRVTIAIDGRRRGEVSLHRIYDYCLKAKPKDCADIRSDFIAKAARLPPRPTLAGLRLVVRNRDYVEGLNRTMADGAPGWRSVTKPIGEDLFAVLAAETPDATIMVGNEQLAALGLTAADAWRRAAAQTGAVLPPLPKPEQLAVSPVAFQDYGHLASLLIDLPAWRDIARAVGPELFVTAVSDQFVFVAKMPDGPKLNAFRRTVSADCAAQQRCITPYVYRFRDGRWVIAR